MNDKDKTENLATSEFNTMLLQQLTQVAASEARIKVVLDFLAGSALDCKDCGNAPCDYHRKLVAEVNQALGDLVVTAGNVVDTMFGEYSQSYNDMKVDVVNWPSVCARWREQRQVQEDAGTPGPSFSPGS